MGKPVVFNQRAQPLHALVESFEDGGERLVGFTAGDDAQVAADPARRATDVKRLRRALELTQQGFCDRFGIPLGTLRDWEQGRSEPDKPARAYLRAIAGDAEAVSRALENGPR